ncbi:unnamed protein product [Boreogadus saida]
MRHRLPSVEPAIASLMLAPDEALRSNARCPRPKSRVTDDLLSKAYDAAARMARIGNSLSHLLLGLSTSLQQAKVEPLLQSLSDASLQAFALMSRELGRTMSTLVQTRRQVWLAQSPLTETCLGAPRLSPSGAFSHRIAPVAYGGLSGLRNSLRTAFGPPNAYLPGYRRPGTRLGYSCTWPGLAVNFVKSRLDSTCNRHPPLPPPLRGPTHC